MYSSTQFDEGRPHEWATGLAAVMEAALTLSSAALLFVYEYLLRALITLSRFVGLHSELQREKITGPVAAARAVGASGAWAKSEHDMYLRRGSVGA